MKLLLCLISVLVGSTAQATNSPSTPVSTHQNWGNLETVNQYGKYYFAAAPDEAALEAFKKIGGKTVIDLRTTKEMDCSEIALAAKHDLKYANVQFDKTQPIKTETIAQIEKAVKESDGPVLLHCETGNRAAAWLAIHLIEKEKMKRDQALKIAKDVGLKPGDMTSKVQKYVK